MGIFSFIGKGLKTLAPFASLIPGVGTVGSLAAGALGGVMDSGGEKEGGSGGTWDLISSLLGGASSELSDEAKRDWEEKLLEMKQEWGTEEREAGQEWGTGERIGGQEWSTGERIGSQEWQNAMRDKLWGHEDILRGEGEKRLAPTQGYVGMSPALQGDVTRAIMGNLERYMGKDVMEKYGIDTSGYATGEKLAKPELPYIYRDEPMAVESPPVSSIPEEPVEIKAPPKMKMPDFSPEPVKKKKDRIPPRVAQRALERLADRRGARSARRRMR